MYKHISIIKKNLFLHSSFGKALITIGEYEDALKQLIKARSLEPHDETIRKTIQIVS